MTTFLVDLSDFELAFLYQKEGDEGAIYELMRRYKYYSYKIIHEILSTNKNCGVSFDDLRLVAMSTISNCAKSISKEYKSFFVYYRLSLRRDLIAYINQNSYFVGGKSFNGLSLSSPIRNSEDDLSFADIIGFNDSSIDIESEIQKILASNALCKKERDVLALYWQGKSFKEIAKQKHCSLSEAYHLFSCAVKSLRKIIKERYF